MKAIIGKRGILLLAVLGGLVLAMGAGKADAASWKMKDASVYTSKKKTMKIKKITKWEKKQLKWSSSDKKIATVTSSGVITAKKKGTVTITVKVGRKSAKVKIKVK